MDYKNTDEFKELCNKLEWFADRKWGEFNNIISQINSICGEFEDYEIHTIYEIHDIYGYNNNAFADDLIRCKVDWWAAGYRIKDDGIESVTDPWNVFAPIVSSVAEYLVDEYRYLGYPSLLPNSVHELVKSVVKVRDAE